MECTEAFSEFYQFLTPIIVGLLTTASALLGSYYTHKNRAKESLNKTRSKKIPLLFARINELERSVINIGVCLNINGDIKAASTQLKDSIHRLLSTYDSSSVYFPGPVSKIIDRMLEISSSLRINIITEKSDNPSLVKTATSTATEFRKHKEELRSALQAIIGVNK